MCEAWGRLEQWEGVRTERKRLSGKEGQPEKQRGNLLSCVCLLYPQVGLNYPLPPQPARRTGPGEMSPGVQAGPPPEFLFSESGDRWDV